jgi:hypothetical protein
VTPATRAVLGLAALGVIAIVGYRWPAREAAPDVGPASAPVATLVPTIRPGIGFAPPPAAAAAPAGAVTETLLRAALQRRFHGVLPRELEDRLRAGGVREVAERLAGATAPGSAAALAELAALCQESAATGADEATARAPQSPGTAAALAPLEAARRTALERLRGGCAAAHFDLAAINERLTATANGGDVASLERLALSGIGPARLASAALLGAPRAQWRMALDQQKEHPQLARSWLEAAARKDADAGAYYGSCLLAGCFGTPDPVAARAALEAAARRGSVAALGLLVGADAAGPWSSPDVPVVPVPPPGTDALGLGSTDRLAWATLAGELARRGCFGLDLPSAALALGARDRLAAQLAPSAGELGDGAGKALLAETGDATRESLGCN